jgi:CheY-like chemotaxis protein
VLASPLLLRSDFLHKPIGFDASGLTVPKILIADDSEFLRTHLRSFLQRPDWVVCGEAANGRRAVLMASQLKPDLIVLDFAMPMINGIQAAEEILKTTPRVPIVLYTLHKNPQLDLDATKVGISKVISYLRLNTRKRIGKIPCWRAPLNSCGRWAAKVRYRTQKGLDAISKILLICFSYSPSEPRR